MKTCSECKHRKKPNGEFPQRGWCSNPKSPYAQSYVYKGDTCDEFKAKRKKSKLMAQPTGDDIKLSVDRRPRSKGKLL